MKVLPTSQKAIEQAVDTIRSGGIVAHATETCYGFACDITNKRAVQKLFALKKRPEGMPVSALFSSIEDAKEYVEWSEEAEVLAGKYLPGPLTIILPRKGSTLGIRVSSHPTAQKLAELYGSPLSTTSANLYGQPETYSAHEIEKQFADQHLRPDLILDSGTLPQAPPSTVCELVDGKVHVLRQGGIKI